MPRRLLRFCGAGEVGDFRPERFEALALVALIDSSKGAHFGVAFEGLGRSAKAAARR